ncbi:MAG: M6 family metalloprotease domain-containing protein [Muribaculaceae bacterium]|nr:M6 family metalloprotease domain-containing protein [Muribaculaceae bacterium]
MFRVTIKQLMAVMAITLTAIAASAVPAKPGLQEHVQSDGTVVKVQLVGDEWSHFYLTEDGYLLEMVGTDFYYADLNADGTLKNSQIRATAPDARPAAAQQYLNRLNMEVTRATMEKVSTERRARKTSVATDPTAKKGPGLFSDTHFPHFGAQKGLVILVEYKDVKMKSGAKDYFTRMLNDDNFADNGATGSAAQYFRDNSMNQFQPQFDVYGPVTLSQNRSYYGGNNYYGDDSNPGMMVKEACDQLNGQINFKDYDRDGDGYVDNVYIFYAGRGENEGGGSNTVWPHSWDLYSALGYTPMYDGVYVYKYGCSNSVFGASERWDGIGTFVHEFGHILGLPDLYATSYTGAFTPGEWDVMDGGSYNNNSNTPPYYSGFERYALDWVNPTVISDACDITINPIAENDVYLIKGQNSNKYFIFENRQQTGWDRYIPGHGMLAWRIKYDSSVWNNNVVNNTPSKQYVDIIEADGSQSDYSRAGDAYPGTSRVTSISRHTDIDGYSVTNLPFTEITEAGGLISFKVAGGNQTLDPPTNLNVTNVTPTSFTANWNATPRASGYRMFVYVQNANGSVTMLEKWNSRNVGNVTSVTISDLTPGTKYLWTVIAYNNTLTSERSENCIVTTADITIEYLTVELDENNASYNWFEFDWKPVEGATNYLVDVYTKELTGTYETMSTIPSLTDFRAEGWDAIAADGDPKTYNVPTLYSSGPVSLRVKQTGDGFITPQFEGEIKELSFWQRDMSAAGNHPVEAYFSVQGLNSAGAWVEVDQLPLTTTGKFVSTDKFETGMYKARVILEIAQHSDGFSGDWSIYRIAVDDPTVKWGSIAEVAYVEGHKDYLHAADELSHRVDNARPSTNYYYKVTATDGANYSIPSAEGIVRTLDAATGVEMIGHSRSISIDGLNLHVDVEGSAQMAVTSITGAVLWTGEVSTGFTYTFPSRGVYIVTLGNRVFKLRI